MTVTLDDIAGEPALADALTPEIARELWKRLMVVGLAIMPHVYAPVETSLPDRLLDVGEAARRLDVSTTTLYRQAGDYPFTRRMGGRLKFSERGIERWLERR